MKRVAELLASWAEEMGLGEEERDRWKATGWLHDTMRDAPADRLLSWVDHRFAELPVGFLHGPAAAARLEAEGCRDRELLEAIRYHTLTHPSLGQLGLALIAADFLEPGRRTRPEWREEMRRKATRDFRGVVRAVLRARIERGLEKGQPPVAELVALLSRLTRDEEAGQDEY